MFTRPYDGFRFGVFRHDRHGGHVAAADILGQGDLDSAANLVGTQQLHSSENDGTIAAGKEKKVRHFVLASAPIPEHES